MEGIAGLTFLLFVIGLIDDSAVLQRPQIKHANTAVCAAGDEDVHAVGAEAHIENFFVVSDELCLCRQSWYIPYGACRVD